MSGFNYSAYYQRVQDSKTLQIPKERMSWIERFEPPDRAYEVVLYLGCNILRTPDIAADVTWVFEHLGVDFVATAGVQFCCGITWDRGHDDDLGRGVSQRSVQRLAAYQPKTVVFWCPSCNVHYEDIIMGRDGREAPFAITHCTTFLAERAQRGELPWVRDVPRRVALHTHVGREGHAVGRRRSYEDRTSCTSVLEHVPGVEVLGWVNAPPEFDYDCGTSSADVERGRWLEIRAGLVDEARAMGADTLVTISHACQREWCDAGDEGLEVRNYISLVADSLGIERGYEVDLLGTYKRTAEPKQIVDRSRPAWSSHGLSEQRALEIASKYTWGATSPRSTAP
ncbi:MAG: heterodisulfide reductase-related iron-sulfur binding cluster [Acidimicrobiales bacterium]